ncbi:hypothetical protein SEVIR_3G319500v4 [Setaria viridis]
MASGDVRFIPLDDCFLAIPLHGCRRWIPGRGPRICFCNRGNHLVARHGHRPAGRRGHRGRRGGRGRLGSTGRRRWSPPRRSPHNIHPH